MNEFGSSHFERFGYHEETNNLWNEALERLTSAGGDTSEFINFTMENQDVLEDFMEKHQDSLTPEQLFFLRMSIRMKQEGVDWHKKFSEKYQTKK